MSEYRIDREWREYRDKVVDPEATADELESQEMAFKAGALAYHNLLDRIADTSTPEAERVETMRAIDRELRAFSDEAIIHLKGRLRP